MGAVSREPASAVRAAGRTTDVHVESVGYEGREIDEFVADLAGRGVELLVDVRLNAVSRKRGFAKTALCEALATAGIDYLHLRALGNPKVNRPLFARTDPRAGRKAYRALLDEPEARAALTELRRLTTSQHVALLCFEADERHCHRYVVLEALGERSPSPRY